MRLGGIAADADLSPTRWTAAIQQAKQRGVKPLVSESGLFFRVPITNDVATYFIDQKYDGRDAESLTEAEIHGREQARAYLQAIRTIPGCEHAYILATRPEIGTRESRHVNARYQVTTRISRTERASTMWCAWGHGRWSITPNQGNRRCGGWSTRIVPMTFPWGRCAAKTHTTCLLEGV